MVSRIAVLKLTSVVCADRSCPKQLARGGHHKDHHGTLLYSSVLGSAVILGLQKWTYQVVSPKDLFEAGRILNRVVFVHKGVLDDCQLFLKVVAFHIPIQLSQRLHSSFAVAALDVEPWRFRDEKEAEEDQANRSPDDAEGEDVVGREILVDLVHHNALNDAADALPG